MEAPGQLAKASPPHQHHLPPPGSLHPLWLAKGMEGGGRGTAEKTRLGRMAFEHQRSAAALSETYNVRKECTRLHCNRVRRHCGKIAGPGALATRLSWPLKHEFAVGVG